MDDRKKNYRDNADHDPNFNRKDDFNDADLEMNLEDKWYDIKEEYRERFTDLTDEDVNYGDGRFEEMLERIGRKRGRSRREIQREIENW